MSSPIPIFFSKRANFLTPKDSLNRREEAVRLLILRVLTSPDPFPFILTLILRGWCWFIQLDLHDLVTREVTQDELPCHLGYSHKLVGAPYE